MASRRDHTGVTREQGPSLRVDVLGPLRLTVDGRAVDVPGQRRRALLARLVIARGEVVLSDDLVDDVWPGDAPEGGRRPLRTHVWRLRAHLGGYADRLEAMPAGYRLRLDHAESDLGEVAAGAPQLRRLADTAAAAALGPLQRLAGLWRGEALAEFADFPSFIAERAALAELHGELVDALIAAMVACGRATEAVEIARHAAAVDPLRERTVRLLMSALTGDGRAAEALRLGAEFRRHLLDATGLDASDDLIRLERQILGAVPPRSGGSDTVLLGRDAELAELGALVGRHRLICITGAGGVGKTRLATALAASPAAGMQVGFVALGVLPRDADVDGEAARALGLRPTGASPPAAMLADLIHLDKWLLVLDNCEHVLAGGRLLVGHLLDACPNLTVVATSRTPLGMSAEVRVRLRPLDLAPAAQLFVERAQHVRAGLCVDAGDRATVDAIVTRLDGLPLAIELAAGRLGAFSLDDLHERLGRARSLLHAGAGAPNERQSSLRNTIAWSYELLDPDAQRLLCALAVFPDGCSLAAAEVVGVSIELTGDPAGALARLVDASLVEPHLDERPARYRLLETIRGHALEMLEESGGRAAAEAARQTWGRSLVVSIAGAFGGPGEQDGIDRFVRELVNIRAIHEHARATGDVDTRRLIVASLYPFAFICEIADVLVWVMELATELGDAVDAAVAAIASNAAVLRGDLESTEHWARRSLALPGGEAYEHFALDALSTRALYLAQFDQAVDLSLAGAASARQPAWRAMHWLMAALAEGYAGRPAIAAGYLATAGGLADGCGSTLARALVAYARAR